LRAELFTAEIENQITIEFIYLPPYSPNFNLVEYLIHLLRLRLLHHLPIRNQIVYQGAGYSCKRLSRTSVIWSKSYKGNDKANFTGKAAEVNCANLPSGFCSGGKNQITSISSWQRKSR
jgi:hypothetical protein